VEKGWNKPMLRHLKNEKSLGIFAIPEMLLKHTINQPSRA
jgi:hypothetical protein